MPALESSGGLRRQTSGFVFTRAFLDALATQAITEEPNAGMFNEPTAFLFTNEAAPTSGSVLADFTAPTWTGYADEAAITFAVEPKGVGGVSFQATALAQWLVGASPDDAVRGWGLKQGLALIGAQRLSEDVTPIVGEYITLVPEIDLSST